MKYTKELLLEILSEGGAAVLEEYDRYPQRLRVKFRCSCGAETFKRFEMLNLYRLPYCEECSKKHMVDKQKKTCLDKYGVENASSLTEIKEKIKDIFDNKYGGHPKRLKEVQEKWVATCLEKYGGHPNQNREVQVKSEFKGCHYKNYVFPSGRTVKVQGYEPLALDQLLKGGVKEIDIIVGKASVPTVEYWIGDKRHIYFPDIFLQSENKLIEVKSEWSIKFPTNIQEKAEASVASGYLYEIWIYNSKRQFIKKVVYLFDGSIKELPA
jgi:hypothetical protein